MGVREKAREWLRIHVVGERGTQARAVKDVGIDQSAASRIVRGERSFTIGHAEKMAEHAGKETWQILKEIETFDFGNGGDIVREGSSRHNVVSVNLRFERWFRDFLERDPRRARRLALNIQHQDELGYTDLISKVVRLIVDLGPQQAALKAAALLDDFQERETARRKRLRSQFREEYKRIR